MNPTPDPTPSLAAQRATQALIRFANNDLKTDRQWTEAEAATKIAQIIEHETRTGEMERLLFRLANKHGRCGVCKSPCTTFTECDCEHGFWEPCDPASEATALLSRLPAPPTD